MSKFIHLPDTKPGDFAGVHFNSGIPDKAFFLTASHIGGFAWEASGSIWYASLKATGAHDQFEDFASTTFQKAGELFGTGGTEQSAVLSAWQEVEVPIRGVPRPPQVLETATLPEDAAAELARLVAAAVSMSGQEQDDRARDAMSYSITVEDGDRTTALEQSDGAMPPAYAALLTWLRKHFAQQ
ncbi:protealysin inhibitor emfourin [Streptomyces lavendulae]|uniref:protealysin inhibitor emfourin n=1 Tax=Streptomyces lavendulae TaxID=1914 RepID=UPI0036F0A437